MAKVGGNNDLKEGERLICKASLKMSEPGGLIHMQRAFRKGVTNTHDKKKASIRRKNKTTGEGEQKWFPLMGAGTPQDGKPLTKCGKDSEKKKEKRG